MSEDELEKQADRYAAIADGFDKIVEVVAGYKAKLVAAGFTTPTAEAMSIHMHERIMRSIPQPPEKS